jgi:hypothetical protein
MCALIFSTNFFRNIPHSKKNLGRYYHKYTSVPCGRTDMVRQTDGRTDGRKERHYEAKGCFSQFCGRAYNLIRTVSGCVPSDSITFKLNPYRHTDIPCTVLKLKPLNIIPYLLRDTRVKFTKIPHILNFISRKLFLIRARIQSSTINLLRLLEDFGESLRQL